MRPAPLRAALAPGLLLLAQVATATLSGSPGGTFSVDVCTTGRLYFRVDEPGGVYHMRSGTPCLNDQAQRGRPAEVNATHSVYACNDGDYLCHGDAVNGTAVCEILGGDQRLGCSVLVAVSAGNGFVEAICKATSAAGFWDDYYFTRCDLRGGSALNCARIQGANSSLCSGGLPVMLDIAAVPSQEQGVRKLATTCRSLSEGTESDIIVLTYRTAGPPYVATAQHVGDPCHEIGWMRKQGISFDPAGGLVVACDTTQSSTPGSYPHFYNMIAYCPHFESAGVSQCAPRGHSPCLGSGSNAVNTFAFWVLPSGDTAVQCKTTAQLELKVCQAPTVYDRKEVVKTGSCINTDDRPRINFTGSPSWMTTFGQRLYYVSHVNGKAFLMSGSAMYLCDSDVFSRQSGLPHCRRYPNVRFGTTGGSVQVAAAPGGAVVYAVNGYVVTRCYLSGIIAGFEEHSCEVVNNAACPARYSGGIYRRGDMDGIAVKGDALLLSCVHWGIMRCNLTSTGAATLDGPCRLIGENPCGAYDTDRKLSVTSTNNRISLIGDRLLVGCERRPAATYADCEWSDATGPTRCRRMGNSPCMAVASWQSAGYTLGVMQLPTGETIFQCGFYSQVCSQEVSPTATSVATSTYTLPTSTATSAAFEGASTVTVTLPTGSATATVTFTLPTGTATGTSTVTLPTGSVTGVATVTLPTASVTATATMTLPTVTVTGTTTFTLPTGTVTGIATVTLPTASVTATATMTLPTVTVTGTTTFTLPTGTVTGIATVTLPTGTATSMATVTLPTATTTVTETFTLPPAAATGTVTLTLPSGTTTGASTFTMPTATTVDLMTVTLPTAITSTLTVTLPTGTDTVVVPATQTVVPQTHPCDDGSHGCDKNGHCYKGRTRGGVITWFCECNEGYVCKSSCHATPHECVAVTAGPTAAPATASPTVAPASASPTAAPTSPTGSPTGSPQQHQCNTGEHGCDPVHGVCIEMRSANGPVWDCACRPGYTCAPNCHVDPHVCRPVPPSPSGRPTSSAPVPASGHVPQTQSPTMPTDDVGGDSPVDGTAGAQPLRLWLVFTTVDEFGRQWLGLQEEVANRANVPKTAVVVDWVCPAAVCAVGCPPTAEERFARGCRRGNGLGAARQPAALQVQENGVVVDLHIERAPAGDDPEDTFERFLKALLDAPGPVLKRLGLAQATTADTEGTADPSSSAEGPPPAPGGDLLSGVSIAFGALGGLVLALAVVVVALARRGKPAAAARRPAAVGIGQAAGPVRPAAGGDEMAAVPV
eukprot:TRINITY_DN964_c0_g1_i6.p1 TRINITY_DN964_c0_g1~~TRINITY_DN964_c0_g1_i6.p1  ORF type:complete len:1307 (+),score=123.97 TRINITY_DN964_c0_g1_i6:105-3923(+)